MRDTTRVRSLTLGALIPAYGGRQSTLVQREDLTNRVSRGTVCTLHPARADGGDTHGKRNQDTTRPSCMVKASFAWS